MIPSNFIHPCNIKTQTICHSFTNLISPWPSKPKNTSTHKSKAKKKQNPEMSSQNLRKIEVKNRAFRGQVFELANLATTIDRSKKTRKWRQVPVFSLRFPNNILTNLPWCLTKTFDGFNEYGALTCVSDTMLLVIASFFSLFLSTHLGFLY